MIGIHKCDFTGPPYELYFIYDPSMHAVKIGYTKNLHKRLKALQSGNAAPLRILGTARCETQEHARGAEQEYHAKFAPARIAGEWFSLHDPDLQALIEWFDTPSGGLRDQWAPV